MKAKCPNCQTGCARCVDGYIEVRLAPGDCYTRACTNPVCRFMNGGRMSTVPLTGSCGQCVHCGEAAEWMLV